MHDTKVNGNKYHFKAYLYYTKWISHTVWSFIAIVVKLKSKLFKRLANHNKHEYNKSRSVLKQKM